MLLMIFQDNISFEETWNNIQQSGNKIEVKTDENFKGTKDITNIKNTKREVLFTPTMVFSVVGDSDNFVPRAWPKTVFQTALIEAAKSGGGRVTFAYTSYCI